jgi:hypothetical protein
MDTQATRWVIPMHLDVRASNLRCTGGAARRPAGLVERLSRTVRPRSGTLSLKVEYEVAAWLGAADQRAAFGGILDWVGGVADRS